MARMRDVKRLSQMPLESFASVLADSGAMRTMSAHRRSCILMSASVDLDSEFVDLPQYAR